MPSYNYNSVTDLALLDGVPVQPTLITAPHRFVSGSGIFRAINTEVKIDESFSGVLILENSSAVLQGSFAGGLYLMGDSNATILGALQGYLEVNKGARAAVIGTAQGTVWGLGVLHVAGFVEAKLGGGITIATSNNGLLVAR